MWLGMISEKLVMILQGLKLYLQVSLWLGTFWWSGTCPAVHEWMHGFKRFCLESLEHATALYLSSAFCLWLSADVEAMLSKATRQVDKLNI